MYREKKRYPIRSCTEPLDNNVFFKGSVSESCYGPELQSAPMFDGGVPAFFYGENCREHIFLREETRPLSMERTADCTYFWSERGGNELRMEWEGIDIILGEKRQSEEF